MGPKERRKRGQEVRNLEEYRPIRTGAPNRNLGVAYGQPTRCALWQHTSAVGDTNLGSWRRFGAPIVAAEAREMRRRSGKRE